MSHIGCKTDRMTAVNANIVKRNGLTYPSFFIIFSLFPF